MTLMSKMEIDEKNVKGEGFKPYYITKIEELQLIVAEKSQNLRRLQAQRNELNAKVRMLREELQLLQEQGSYVGEVVKPMDKKKVLVKVHPEGKFVVDIDKNIDINDVTPNSRVALRNESYTLHKILPNKVDPLVSLMMVEKVPDSTYEMVGGLDKQIKEIKEVIELPVKHPELFDALGIAQPKGVLLYGPPGTGKTLLARAVAHHTECTFIRVSGSELVQKFIGEGSRMVRELFVMAREHAPSIIFMDEIDSIGSSRIESGSGGDSEVQRTMLELLNQLDGFEATKNIKVIMATNRIDILDPALLRPGRIDRKIEFPPPNEEARLDILKIHSRKMNLTRGINLRKIAELMPGASGAEVKGVCTEAGMYALRERRVHVTQEDFEMAVAKVHFEKEHVIPRGRAGRSTDEANNSNNNTNVSGGSTNARDRPAAGSAPRSSASAGASSRGRPSDSRQPRLRFAADNTGQNHLQQQHPHLPYHRRGRPPRTRHCSTGAVDVQVIAVGGRHNSSSNITMVLSFPFRWKSVFGVDTVLKKTASSLFERLVVVLLWTSWRTSVAPPTTTSSAESTYHPRRRRSSSVSLEKSGASRPMHGPPLPSPESADDTPTFGERRNKEEVTREDPAKHHPGGAQNQEPVSGGERIGREVRNGGEDTGQTIGQKCIAGAPKNIGEEEEPRGPAGIHHLQSRHRDARPER
ncbi:26S protease regulatory subunit 8 [Camponotus floridanus]|uniref:26S proteasome regulatory subunit 8 n=1 Tax=Camponotus floridanus TaxID=104421 RepID=E2ALV6_CAMFO|nr:26S protease regulatory subunit 8 [Camponotus floridanus]